MHFVNVMRELNIGNNEEKAGKVTSVMKNQPARDFVIKSYFHRRSRSKNMLCADNLSSVGEIHSKCVIENLKYCDLC